MPPSIVQIAQNIDISGDHVAQPGLAFVDVDAVDFSLTLTTEANYLHIAADLSLYIAAFRYAGWDFAIDGVRLGQTFGLAYAQAIYCNHLHVEALKLVAAGQHTVRLQWRGSSADTLITIRASAAYVPAQFTVMELHLP